MSKLTCFLLCFVLAMGGVTGQDYNYEFVTDGTSMYLPTSPQGQPMEDAGLKTGYVKVRVNKSGNQLIITNNELLNEVKFRGQVNYVGRNHHGDQVYGHVDGSRKWWLHVNPADGYVHAFRASDNKTMFSYGLRPAGPEIRVDNPFFIILDSLPNDHTKGKQ